MKVAIAFVRKEEVSVSIKLVDSSVTEQEVLDGLTTGQFEIMERSREVVNVDGGVVGHVVAWDVDDLTHGSFELLED